MAFSRELEPSHLSFGLCLLAALRDLQLGGIVIQNLVEVQDFLRREAALCGKLSKINWIYCKHSLKIHVVVHDVPQNLMMLLGALKVYSH